MRDILDREDETEIHFIGGLKKVSNGGGVIDRVSNGGGVIDRVSNGGGVIQCI